MDERQIGGDDLVRALARWAADQRVTEAAASRSWERWLRDQAVASATFDGVLVDVAERGAPVLITLLSGRRTGRLVGVGPDFCVLHQGGGRPAIVALSAITSVTVTVTVADGPDGPDGPHGPAGAAPAGDRPPVLELSLAAALGALADERTPVGLCLRAGETLDGDLVAAGQDVLTVRSAARAVFVPLRAVMVCELR